MAISYDITTFVSAGDATTSTGNLSHTVGAARLLVVMVAVRRSATGETSLSSVVWNSQSLTAVTSTLASNSSLRGTTAIYYLLNPTAATGNLVVTWTSGHLCSYAVVAINVLGTTGIPVNGTGDANSASSNSVDVTSVSGRVIDIFATLNTRTITETAGQTLLFPDLTAVGTSGMKVGGSYKTSTPPTTSMGWTIDSSANYAHSACRLVEDTGTGNFLLFFQENYETPTFIACRTLSTAYMGSGLFYWMGY